MGIRVFVILAAACLFRAYALNVLYPLSYGQDPLFLPELSGFNIVLPFWSIMILGLVNLCLVWLIATKIFNRRVAEVAALLYAVSPWVIYQEVAGSVYILLLFGLLLAFSSVLLLRSAYSGGYVLLVLSVVLLLSSSLLMWLVVPVLVIGLFSSGLISGDIKRKLLASFVVLIPLAFLLLQNPVGLKNIAGQRIEITANLSLLNSVNAFRGDDLQTPYYKLGRFIDNRYVYFAQHLIFSISKHLNPVTYFTPDVKLLGFSAHPPVFLAWLVPFLAGLTAVKKLWENTRYASFALSALFLPSLLSLEGFDINRLILVLPLVIYITSWGWVKLTGIKKLKAASFAVALLICLQALVLLADLPSRERQRYEPISSQANTAHE